MSLIKTGKTKIGLLDNDNNIICFYRGYCFGGLVVSDYVNITILCGSLKNESISIKISDGKCITFPKLRFKFLGEVTQ